MARLAAVFAVDLRGLALLRVWLAVVLLFDLAIRGADLGAWVTGAGVLPLEAAAELNSPWRFSLYFASDSWLWAGLLHLLAAVLALMLLLGWHTRLAAFGSWLLLLSLHNRMPLLLQGGDNLLLLLLLWAQFLPMGARWSVDAALARQPMADNRYVSVASAALLIQAMSVYFFSAFLKSGQEWLPDGTAIHYALQLDQFATLLAPYWREQFWLTQPLTYYVWYLELLGPLLIFSPWWRVPLRTLGVILFVTLEIGFILNLSIGLFPFISIGSVLLFLPSEIWDRIERLTRRAELARATLYFDRDCGFCEKSCHLLRTALLLGPMRIRPAQEVAEVNTILQANFSWVYEDASGARHLRSSALAAMLRDSPWLFWLAPVVRLLRPLADRVYHQIGLRRSTLSRWTTAHLAYTEGTWRPGRPTQALAALLLAYITWWNIATLELPRPQGEGVLAMPAELLPVKYLLRLDQKWNMFAPYPKKDDGWFVIPGRLLDGSAVDVLKGRAGAPDFAKPESFDPEQFSNYRWRKYLGRLWLAVNSEQRLHYGRWLCRTWNAAAEGDRRLAGFNLYFIRERTAGPGEAAQLSSHRLWRHSCLPGFERSRGDAIDRLGPEI